jgi:hypothetical protein
MSKKSPDANEFEQEAHGRRMSIIGEFWEFLKYNKKWWLLPILLVLLLMGVLVILGAAGIGPFIYALG